MGGASLNLMQINVAGSNEQIAPFAERLEQIISIIDRNMADMVAVQAGVDAGGSDAPLAALALELGDHPHLARAGGMALFSRVPIEAADAVPLRQLGLPEDPFQRQLLIVRLAPPAPVVAIGHFSWVTAQAEANVADALGALAGLGDTLLVGDFNQPPESPALAALAEAGFVDPWTRLNRAEAGHSYPTGAPDRRIDYVLERATAPLVTALALVPGDFSDHAALVARIER